LYRRSILALTLITLTCSGFAQSPSSKPDFTATRDEAVRFLGDLVRMDTSNPPGNESQAAKYIQGVLKQEGIDSELLEPVPGRASVVARLRGNGSKRPVLIMGHIDVVPIDRAHWTTDPFSGTVQDSILHGRGSLDDKAMVSANLEVFLQLHRLHVSLTRDVIFLAEASEEMSSPAGMATLVDRYWDKLNCEFALNEGGVSLLKDGKLPYLGVGTAEKLPRGVTLRAEGSSGHGSIPRPDNAVTHLAMAVAKTGNWVTPARLNETTRVFFDGLAKISPPEEAAWYRNVEDPKVQEILRVKKPIYYSMLRTSVVPTMLKAGFKSNVIPPTAEGVLDIRALPDEDLEKFRASLAAVINDPQVKVVPEDATFSMVPSAPSSLHTAMFQALQDAQKQVFPESITLPIMQTGATDSSFLRAKGAQAYGLAVPRTEQENATVHGNDERVQTDQLGNLTTLIYLAVTQVGTN
jgi:acetylornithine deacetylase/succinyl-diaminopimelate desuccinylase-like protein